MNIQDTIRAAAVWGAHRPFGPLKRPSLPRTSRSARQGRQAPILELLRERGPMHVRDIADALGWATRNAAQAIQTCRRHRPGEAFRIVRYEAQVGKWGPDLPVYSARGGKDAEKPIVSRDERRQIARKRHRAKFIEVYRAQDRVRNAVRRAKGAPVLNIWAPLAPRELRGLMTRVAANTSSMAEAA